MRIPRCMSTQHPDNVNLPFFAETPEMGGEDEIQEAFYVFSHLGCNEQMWDCEGKEVDAFVVKKLLTRFAPFFEENILGRDLFLTLRVPNPTVEKTEAKVLLETLESIPRSFDAAQTFYQSSIAPVFEVILPMTTSFRCIDRVLEYYEDFVVGKQNQRFKKGDITIAEWIGDFKPETINVIPLIEDMPSLLNIDSIVARYLRGKDFDYQRVFLARSDPALNYGLVSAVLLNKIALWKLHLLEQEIAIPIYPIVGVGSAPFRGNLRPSTVGNLLREYPSVYTFTIQSSFKYDNVPSEVREGTAKIEEHQTEPPHEVDIERCLEIIEKYAQAYAEQIKELAPLVNKVARVIPSRRTRKLHIGLFGYSRDVQGVNLPRAITFTAALYSVGLPPEILGLHALSKEDIQFVSQVFLNFENKLKTALRFFNPEMIPKISRLRDAVEDLPVGFKPDPEYQRITGTIMELLENGREENLKEHVLRAANMRGFLG